MHRATRFNIHTFLIGLSAATLTLVSACSDTSSPTRLPTSDAASADRGGGSGGNNNTQGNRGPGNQGDQGNRGPGNQNDTTQQRMRVTVVLVAPADAALPRASGKAKLDQRSDRTELEIEVEHIAPGTVVTFFAGGTQLGQPVTASSFGEAEVKLDSRRETVPAIAVGTVITAKSAAGGTLVSGTF